MSWGLAIKENVAQESEKLDARLTKLNWRQREAYLLEKILDNFPMDPVERDGWLKRIEKDDAYSKALLSDDHVKILDYTPRFLVSLYEWRLQEHRQYIYVIYGKLGMGKTIFSLTFATLTQQKYPNAEIRCIMTYEGMLKFIQECPEHSIGVFDEDLDPTGTESYNIKKYLKNESKGLRLKSINIILSYKKKTVNDLSEMANGIFEMFGFNPETGESRAMMFDSNYSPLGTVILMKNFSQEIYDQFDQKKLIMFTELLNNGGRIGAHDTSGDTALVEQFLGVFEKEDILPSEVEGMILNYAISNKIEIQDTTLKRLVKRLKPLVRRANKTQKKKQSDMVIDPIIIGTVTERITADRAGKLIKSAPRIESWLRAYCTDIIPLEQMNAVATLIYVNRRADRESIQTFKQECNSPSQEKEQDGEFSYERAENPETVLIGDPVLHLLDLVCENMKPYVENQQDYEMFLDRVHGMQVNQIAEKWLGSYKNVRPINAAILRVQEGPLGTYGMEMAYCNWLMEKGYTEKTDFEHAGMYGHASDIINHRDREIISLKINTTELTAKNKQKLGVQHIRDALKLCYTLFEGVLVISELKFKKFRVSVLRNSQRQRTPEIPCPSLPGQADGGGGGRAAGSAAAASCPPTPAQPPLTLVGEGISQQEENDSDEP